jgi:hypothetical protein
MDFRIVNLGQRRAQLKCMRTRLPFVREPPGSAWIPAPAEGQLFQQNSAANTLGLMPVTANSAEAGVRGGLGRWFVYELDAYDMRISNDMIADVTPQNAREASSAGHTRLARCRGECRCLAAIGASR